MRTKINHNPMLDGYCNLCNHLENAEIELSGKPTVELVFTNSDEWQHTAAINLCQKHAAEMAETLKEAFNVIN